MKTKHDKIRSGFEALLIVGTALAIAPATIIMASAPTLTI